MYKSNAELGIIMPGATAAHWEQFEAMTATASTPEAIKRFLRLKTIASREAMDSIYTTKRAPDVICPSPDEFPYRRSLSCWFFSPMCINIYVLLVFPPM